MDDELHVASKRDTDSEAARGANPPRPVDGEVPEDAAWRRWVVGRDPGEFRLLPVMPDRPVVARPDTPIEILPGQEAVFFVSIPVFVRVVAGEGKGATVCEEPTVILSNTWFGEPVGGELCYSLQTRARREASDGDALVHRAVCAIRASNASAEPLSFERLCIRAPHLKTFDSESQLWTNGVRVTFRGEDHGSHVDYDEDPLRDRGVGELLSEPRDPVTRGLIRRSFVSLRSLTGI